MPLFDEVTESAELID